jgi:hypothetical protein
MFCSNAFVTKLSADGAHLVWSTYLGGTTVGEYDDVKGGAVDVHGGVVVSGTTNSKTFPVTPGALQTRFPRGEGTTFAGFVSRLEPDGSALVYSTFLTAPTGGNTVGPVAVDPSGVATVLGDGGGPTFPTTPGAYDPVWNNSLQGTVSRLSPRGDRLFYSTFFGGPGEELEEGVGLSAEGRVAICGYVYAPGGYPTTPNAFQQHFNGGQIDGTLTVFDLFLRGVENLGASTPSCDGPLVANATVMPTAGIERFSVTCSAAPAGANGYLLIGEPLAMSKSLRGADVWIDLGAVHSILRVQSDGDGFAEAYLPIPDGTRGRRFSCQYVFLNTSACRGSTPVSASNALTITVQ